MWNWNKIESLRIELENLAFNWTNVELKLRRAIDTECPNLSFNWTNVELKPDVKLAMLTLHLELLIEPMWNWNKVTRKEFMKGAVAFNWTNVELKLGQELTAQYVYFDF